MLIAMISVKGSPGVTTLSVALAARWSDSERCVLVEADPAGGDLAARFNLAPSPGLVSLAAAGRRSADPELVWQHAQHLPGGLAVVTAPAEADTATAALKLLADSSPHVFRRAADLAATVVVVDCGRADSWSAAMPIVRSSDAMVVLTRSGAADLAHLARRVGEVGTWSPRPLLLLRGDDHPMDEVERALGVPPLGCVPEDRRGAAVLCGRAGDNRWTGAGPMNSALGRFAHGVGIVLRSARQLPHATTPESPKPPALRAIPGVPDSRVSVNGLRLAPSPSPIPAATDVVGDHSATKGAAS